MPQLSAPINRITIRSMVEQDLGYCCLWFFLERYKKTALIAARLGVSTRAVRYARGSVRECGKGCEGRETCLAARIELSEA